MFTDIIAPKFKIERSFFDREVMGYDPKTKKEQTWPYYHAEENSHNQWLSQVQDPITKEFYRGRETTVEYDDNGNEIPDTKKIIEKEPYLERTQIVRLRTRDKKEFLYSRGRMYGYTTYGTLVTDPFQEPEVWQQWTFKHHMAFIQRENRHKEVCDGPMGSIIHYTMPFTKENVDKLMETAVPNVSLVVKEEGGTVKGCPTLEMFRTKPFDYILNMDYLTEKEKEEKRLEFEAVQNNVISKRKQG